MFDGDFGPAASLVRTFLKTALVMRGLQNYANQFFLAQVERYGVDSTWYQQNGATCYTAYVTMDILHEQFEGTLFLARGDLNLQTRSCNLTPLVFFL